MAGLSPYRFAAALGLLTLAVMPAPHGSALAGSTTLSLQHSNERDPDDFSDVLDNIFKFEGAYKFDSGIYMNGSIEIEVPEDGSPNKKNLEGNLGYQHILVSPISLFGSAGIGERFTDDDDFAYYVFRTGLDLAICDQVTWNVITFRYRNAFNTVDDYETPRLTTKLSFHANEHNTIYGELYRNYDSEWDATATGLTIGYAFSFE